MNEYILSQQSEITSQMFSMLFVLDTIKTLPHIPCWPTPSLNPTHQPTYQSAHLQTNARRETVHRPPRPPSPRPTFLTASATHHLSSTLGLTSERLIIRPRA